MESVLAALLLALHLVCASFIGGFWGSASVWWYFRRTRGAATRSSTAQLKFFRRWVWPVYGLWVPLQFAAQDSWVKAGAWAVAYGVGTWLAWRATKDIDDDWWKKLVEKGLGAVERVGNRLRVAVPAPAGA